MEKNNRVVLAPIAVVCNAAFRLIKLKDEKVAVMAKQKSYKPNKYKR